MVKAAVSTQPSLVLMSKNFSNMYRTVPEGAHNCAPHIPLSMVPGTDKLLRVSTKLKTQEDLKVFSNKSKSEAV